MSAFMGEFYMTQSESRTLPERSAFGFGLERCSSHCMRVSAGG